MAEYIGTAGNDDYLGTAGDDTFDMTQGGVDRVKAGDGFNQIAFGATLTADDRIVGGAGFDIVSIQGDYSAGLTLGPDTLHGVDRIQFLAGFDYRLTMVDGNVDPGTQLDLSNDHGANSIWVDASALVNGGSVYTYSNRPNTIIGSQSSDHFQEFTTAFDLDSQDGNDLFELFSGLDSHSRIDGGDGSDTVSMQIDYFGVLRPAQMKNVEVLGLVGGSQVTFTDGNVAQGQTLTVNLGNGAEIGEMVDGSAERNGAYVMNGGSEGDTMIGGRGADSLSGGAGDDQLTGGRGGDSLTGGDGADSFIFAQAGDSLKKAPDLITDFDAAVDHIDLSLIDARADKAGDQAFHLVGKLTHVAGQLALEYDAESDLTHVQGDIDGDGKADLSFDVSGHLTDTAGFVL